MPRGIHRDDGSVDSLVLCPNDHDRKVSPKLVTMRTTTLCNYLLRKILYTIRVSNHLDLDQGQHSACPDLGPNCLQRLSTDNKSQCISLGKTYFMPMESKIWEILFLVPVHACNKPPMQVTTPNFCNKIENEVKTWAHFGIPFDFFTFLKEFSKTENIF